MKKDHNQKSAYARDDGDVGGLNDDGCNGIGLEKDTHVNAYSITPSPQPGSGPSNELESMPWVNKTGNSRDAYLPNKLKTNISPLHPAGHVTPKEMDHYVSPISARKDGVSSHFASTPTRTATPKRSPPLGAGTNGSRTSPEARAGSSDDGEEIEMNALPIQGGRRSSYAHALEVDHSRMDRSARQSHETGATSHDETDGSYDGELGDDGRWRRTSGGRSAKTASTADDVTGRAAAMAFGGGLPRAHRRGQESESLSGYPPVAELYA